MKEVEDPDIGPMIEWTDEEYANITEQGKLARKEFLELLDYILATPHNTSTAD